MEVEWRPTVSVIHGKYAYCASVVKVRGARLKHANIMRKRRITQFLWKNWNLCRFRKRWQLGLCQITSRSTRVDPEIRALHYRTGRHATREQVLVLQASSNLIAASYDA